MSDKDKKPYSIVVKKGKSNDPNNQWYWKLMALNGQTLAVSETYYSKTGAIKTADNLAEYCKLDIVIDDDSEDGYPEVDLRFT